MRETSSFINMPLPPIGCSEAPPTERRLRETLSFINMLLPSSAYVASEALYVNPASSVIHTPCSPTTASPRRRHEFSFPPRSHLPPPIRVRQAVHTQPRPRKPSVPGLEVRDYTTVHQLISLLFLLLARNCMLPLCKCTWHAGSAPDLQKGSHAFCSSCTCTSMCSCGILPLW